MNLHVSKRLENPTPARMVVEVLARFEMAEAMGINGFGLQRYAVDLPDQAMIRPLARILNRVLRYQLSDESKAVFEAAAREAEAGYFAEHFKAPAPDLIRTGFRGYGGQLILHTSLPKDKVLAAVDEALPHPERGRELMCVDAARRSKVDGTEQALQTAAFLTTEFRQEILGAIDRHDDRAKSAAISRLDQLQAAESSLGADLARNYSYSHSQEECEQLAQIPARPNVADWITNSETLDLKALRMQSSRDGLS